jgi:hypothetical protein
MSDGFASLGFTASRLLAKFGTAMTHTAIVAGVYDPVTQTVSAPATVATAIRGLIMDGADSRDERGAALSTVGQRRIYLAGADTTPKIGDRVTVGAATYTINDVLPVYAGDVVALYDVRAARA